MKTKRNQNAILCRFFLIVSTFAISACFKWNHPTSVIQAYEEIVKPKSHSSKQISIAIEQSLTIEARCAQLNSDMQEISNLNSLSHSGLDSTELLRQIQKLQEKPEYVAKQKQFSGCLNKGIPYGSDPISKHRGRISEVTMQYLTAYLSEVNQVLLIDRRYTSRIPSYTVSISITQIIPDITAQDKQNKDLLHNIGYVAQMATPYVGVATSSVMGPVGGLLMGFDVITGIPVGWSSGEKVGEVTADIKIIEQATGLIKSSFSEHVNYGASYSALGDSDLLEVGLGSGNARLSLITLESASQTIAKSVAEKVLQVLGS